MTITDGQIHVWSRVAEPSRQHKPQPIGPLELVGVMDQAGVDRAVLVPPTWAADGNEVALRGARLYPSRFRVMGLIDLGLPESRDRIAAWRSNPAMLGIRLSLHAGEARQMFLDNSIDWLWASAESSGVPVMMYPPGLTKEVAQLARRYPDLRLVIDHLGAALERRASAFEEAATQILDLAPLQNIAVKVSAVPWYSGGTYPFSDLHESVGRVVDAFGPHRTFWGTDWTRLPCTYQEAFSMMPIALGDLSRTELDLVMGKGICEWLNWPD